MYIFTEGYRIMMRVQTLLPNEIVR